MASCTTSQWGSAGTSPQIKLTVTVNSSASDGDTAVLDWKLQYIAEKAASTSAKKSYTVKINGTTVKTDTYDIDGKTGTKTIASGSTNVAKGTSSKTVSFSCSMTINLTWNGVTKTKISASGSISVSAKTSYTIKYDANGGSGEPKNQTKWYGTDLTLSSTQPTRTGYQFVNWKSTRSNGDVYTYKPGGATGYNGDQTLVAQWTPNKLTVNYYSNYATVFEGEVTPTNAVKNNNVKVWSKTYSYNAACSDGLLNYKISAGNSLSMSRTGFTGTGYWGTSTSGGNLVNQGTSFSTGQALASALGKNISGGNASVNVYPQWTENKLTVNYYSNYATYATFEGTEVSVNATANVLVKSVEFVYSSAYSNGLANVQNKNYIYLERTGYAPTGYWGTTTTGGNLVNQSTSFSTGEALAQALGTSLTSSSATVNLYPQWAENAYVLSYDAKGGYGEMAPQTIEWGDYFTLSKNTFKRAGFAFQGWNVYRNLDDTWYVNGQGWITDAEIAAGNYSKKLYPDECSLTFDNSWVSENEDARQYTMYAVWKMYSGIAYMYNGTEFVPYLIYIDNGTSWDPYVAYVDDGSKWDIMS